MVRPRILHRLTAAILAASALWMGPAEGRHRYTEERHGAHVYGNQLQFRGLESDLLFTHRDVEAYLELRFSRRFSSQGLRLELNGYGMCSSLTGDWNDETLVIALDRVRFGNQELFHDRARAILRGFGEIRLRVHGARYRILSARLVLRARHQPRPRPRVTLDRVEPPAREIRQADITFHFHASHGATRFECRHQGEGGYEACASPKRYGGLRDGHHEFRFRALDDQGRPGPAVRYQVYVRAPRPAVIITQVTPSESPTTSREIYLAFRPNGTLHPREKVVCRLDQAPFRECRDSVRYTNLTAGQHAIELRRTHWIHNYPWLEKLCSLPALQAFCPRYTEPVVHAWVVTDGVPAPEFVSTPAALTNQGSAAFQFTSASPASFECSLDGAAFGACQSPVELTNLAEGTHEFRVRATAGGLTSEPISFRWEIDQTAPELVLTSVNPSQSPTSSQTLTLSFSASEPATFACALDGAAPAECASPYTVSGLAEGSHQAVVTARDAAGNESAPLVHEWTVDLTSPAVTIRRTFPEASPSRETRAVFELASSEAAAFTCSLDGGAAAACASPLELTVSEGRHTLTVTAVDGAGNPSKTATHEWEVDLTAPEIRLTRIDPPESPTQSRTMDIAFETTESASVTCELDAGGQIPCTHFSAAGLADGVHRVELIAVDPAGNVSAAAHYQWEVRSVAQVAITAVEPGAPVTSSRTITFTFASTTAASFECSLDGGAFAACASPAAYEGLTDGAHRFAVRGLNLAGEPGPEAAHEWSVDTTGPVVAFGALTPAETVTNVTSLTAEFSGADAVSFICALDGGAEAPCTSPHTVSGLADGAHRLSVAGIDELGNRGNAVTHSWTVDTTGPTVTFTAIDPSGSVVDSLQLTAHFTASETATFECALDGGAFGACSSPHTVTVGEGSHQLSVRATDGLGNQGPAAQHAWTVAVPEAVAAIDSVVPATSPTKETTMTAAFSGTNAVSFRCSLDGAPFADCTSPVSLSGLAEGAHTFKVAGVNAAGRQGTPVAHAWTVDTTGPAVTFGEIIPSGSPVTSTTLSASFSAGETATFECALDGGAFSACTSPHTVSVSQGGHTLAVRATDALGNVGAPATYSWTVDVPAPVTQITAVTPSQTSTNENTITFAFDSVNAVSFECSLDGGAFGVCVSPQSYTGLADGAHSFAVRGINSVGETGAAATYAWAIDTTGPVTTLVSVTPNWSPTAQQSLTAEFVSDEPGAVFYCSLDGAPFAPCTSPYTVNGLADGTHRIRIYAVDQLENAGAQIEYSWVVDSSALTASPLALSNVTSRSAELRWNTNLPSDSQLEFWTGTQPHQFTTVDPAMVTSHFVPLTGLSPFTLYNVRAISRDRDGRMVATEVVQFRTLR